MSRFNKILQDTRDVFKTKWNAGNLQIKPWVVQAIIWVTVVRSLAYGLELFLSASNNIITPVMAFAAIFGIHVWGALMIISVVVLIVGLIFKRSLVVTVGALLCSAVWVAFSIALGFGWFNLGDGGRYFIAAFATAVTWLIFFKIQLQTIRKNGVGANV